MSVRLPHSGLPRNRSCCAFFDVVGLFNNLKYGNKPYGVVADLGRSLARAVGSIGPNVIGVT